MGRRPDPHKHRLDPALTLPRSDTMGDRKGRHIYFIQGGPAGLVKIGSSNDPWERFDGLQRNCPVPLRLIGMIWNAGRLEERRLHSQFDHLRHHSEWFWPTPELLAYIAAHAADPTQPPSVEQGEQPQAS
jgi:T5orf172 domain